jgi:hypothetical protein
MRNVCVTVRLLLAAATALLYGLSVMGVAAAADAEGRVAADAIGVLRRHCFECHGEQRQEGGLRLDQREGLLAGGASGLAVIASEPQQSELLRRVSLPRDDSEAMPPIGPGLSRDERDVLAHWITAGAAWPAAADAPHWAYVPPVRVPLPQAAAAGDRHSPGHEAIDAWVAAAHAAQGFAFAEAARPEVLIRRLSFDLTGLPPSPEQASAFVADPSPAAYEALVDDLLASEEFGVRWARMWLDLARYADSHGYQRDDLRSLWAYRDWVVEALNADMPFDRFTIEQIAGDLLPEATESSRIATGFHRCAPTNVEAGTIPEESRFNQVIDRVNTTAAVWLGTTLECAQCHDHKYDPFSQTDYYRLAAYFNSSESEVARSDSTVPSSIKFLGPAMPLSVDPWAAERADLSDQIREARKGLTAAQEAKKVLEDLAADAAKPGEEPPVEDTDAAELNKVTRSIASIEKTITKLEQRLAEIPKAETLVMRECAEPRETCILERGDLASPGEPVSPGTPSVLPARAEGEPNRLGLAEWLVDRDNPLTARVIVNRIWHEIFGRGIVATLEDFGVKGEPPTHPELLDTLAVDFMEQGWSLKRLIREIVLSRTYQQSARVSADNRARDPDNRWLARGPRLRLDAEAIRDNALAIAGLISLEKGGPSIRPPQPEGLWTKVGGEKYRYEVSPGKQQYRRGLYVVLKRGSPYPAFTTFDTTSRMTCLVKRPRSNTPLQALVLLNDEVFAGAALAFAQRILQESPSAEPATQLQYAFQLALARPPTAAERDVLLRLLAAERQAFAADPGQAAAVLKQSAGLVDLDAEHQQTRAAWSAVAAAILNLDETITKP